MSTIPSRIAAFAAPILLLTASVGVRADPQAPAAPEAAVERAFDQLPEEASTAFGDLCRQKSAKSAPNDFMPDCTSLLARRLDEAAKAPKPAAAIEAPGTAAAAEPKSAPEKLGRLADLPPAKAAGHVPVEAVAVLGPAPAKDAEPPAAEVTAVEVKTIKTRPAAAARQARKSTAEAARAARKSRSQARSPQTGSAQAAAASGPSAEAGPGQPTPQARGASGRKDPWTELRSAPPDAARSAPAQAAAEEPKKGLSLSEFAARLIGAKPKPAEPQAQPPAAPAAQPAAPQ